MKENYSNDPKLELKEWGYCEVCNEEGLPVFNIYHSALKRKRDIRNEVGFQKLVEKEAEKRAKDIDMRFIKDFVKKFNKRYKTKLKIVKE